MLLLFHISLVSVILAFLLRYFAALVLSVLLQDLTSIHLLLNLCPVALFLNLGLWPSVARLLYRLLFCLYFWLTF